MLHHRPTRTANPAILKQETLRNHTNGPQLSVSPRLVLPVDKVLPQALGTQHAPAPEADHAVPDPRARLARREPPELKGRPR